MSLPPTAYQVLRAMHHGATLKVHRDLEGQKFYRLHPLEGETTLVAWEVGEMLQEHGLIESNKKFPAATFWLTEKGQAVMEKETGKPVDR